MADEEKLYTLTEVAQLTDISMPTLQRYKKLFQDRIPSRGAGRTQRYPEEALEVFRELKKENMKKRGRPRKNASDGRPKATVRRLPVQQTPASSSSDDNQGLLTLKQIEELTNISYPTLLRYVKTSLKRIPHRGTGRKRRFLPEAVDVFKTLREESRRGRKSPTRVTSASSTTIRPRPTLAATSSGGSGGASNGDVAELRQAVRELQKSQAHLQREIARLEKELNKPFKVVLKRNS